MKANKVDIIIPVYNVEAYLRRCLNSMLAQTYTHSGQTHQIELPVNSLSK